MSIVALALLTAPVLALRSLLISNPGAASMTGANVSFEEGGRLLNGICAGLTLNIEVNERIAKSAGAAMGSITGGRTEECREIGASVQVVIEASREARFRVAYNSILGTLPRIIGILALISGVRITISASGTTVCRYEGRVAILHPVTRERREALVVESVLFVAEPKLRLVEGIGACAEQWSFQGTMRFERMRFVSLV
ncbi:MAG TPA: hypothetical protein VE972_01470 [Conexibacter sp.]|nr:hypothetical protein [Conexibacter sp.]